MNDNLKDTLTYVVYAIFAIPVIAAVLFIGTIHFRMEARSYNKLCQPKVKATTWDAMWVKLRVGNCNQRKQ